MIQRLPHFLSPRIVSRLAALLLLVPLFAACGGASSDRTLHIWYGTDDPVESQWATQLAANFNRTHKNAHAELTVYNLDDFNSKMQLSLGSGNPPDLAYATPRVCAIPVYVQHHRLVNLTPFAKRYGWAGKLREGLLRDYNSPFALYATHRYNVSPKNVAVYAVPDATAAVAMMYNPAILKKLGLTVPKSLSQLEQDVKLAKTRGYTPLGIGNADMWLGDDWYQTLANTQFSYPKLESELRVSPKFSFRQPAFKAMAAILQRWRSDFNPTYADDDAQDGVVRFFRGRTLFQLISSSEDPQISHLEQQTHMSLSVFAFPGATSSSRPVMPQSGYQGWVIPKAGHDEQGAVSFINWMLGPSMKQFLLNHGVLPAERASPAQAASPWFRDFISALHSARPGVFLDSAPMPRLNATMEGNVTFLLNKPPLETPSFLPRAMQTVYSSHGSKSNDVPDIDCEF